MPQATSAPRISHPEVKLARCTGPARRSPLRLAELADDARLAGAVVEEGGVQVERQHGARAELLRAGEHAREALAQSGRMRLLKSVMLSTSMPQNAARPQRAPSGRRAGRPRAGAGQIREQCAPDCKERGPASNAGLVIRSRAKCPPPSSTRASAPAGRRTGSSSGPVRAVLHAPLQLLPRPAPTSAATFGWNNAELGIFETVLPLVYGLSVFFNGPIADRLGGKKAFLFGAVGVIVRERRVRRDVALRGARPRCGRAPARPTTSSARRCSAAGFSRRGLLTADGGDLGSQRVLPVVRRALDREGQRAVVPRPRARDLRRHLRRADPLRPDPRVQRRADDRRRRLVAVGVLGPGRGCSRSSSCSTTSSWRTPRPTRASAVLDTGDANERRGRGARRRFVVLKKVFASRAAWTLAFSSMMHRLRAPQRDRRLVPEVLRRRVRRRPEEPQRLRPLPARRRGASRSPASPAASRSASRPTASTRAAARR